MYDVSTAVVGAGFIGPVHVEALRRLGIRITGILGCDSRESQSARAALGLPRAYESFDEVLDDPAVQVVHLAVPNVLHYEMAKRALDAGKHVMCEKPLAMNAVQSAELVELARQTGLAAGVCYNIRFYPLNLEARDMVARGDVGTIYHVNGSYVQDWLLNDTDYNWRVLADQGGELRAVADIGTHWMDLVFSITGLKVEAVLADLTTVHKIRKRPLGEVETFTGKMGAQAATEPIEITTDDYGCILFRFQGGAGEASTSRRSPPDGRTACVTRSPARSARWPSTANRPTSSGSAAAPSPTRCCCAIRRCWPTPRAGSSTIPADTTRASPTPSSNASGPSTTPSRAALRRRSIRRSRRVMPKSCSARRSSRATANSSGSRCRPAPLCEPERCPHLSFPRRRESRRVHTDWIPACAGMTERRSIMVGLRPTLQGYSYRTAWCIRPRLLASVFGQFP